MIRQKSKITMLGSTPMSLKELPMAPALISSVVKKKGYEFEFIDINLELFEFCKRDYAKYQEKVELVQDMINLVPDDELLSWTHNIVDRLATSSHLLINVFSHFSQGAALRFARAVRTHWPNMIIVMGGIGSQKYITGTDNPTTLDWTKQQFHNTSSTIFGQLLLNNGVIDGWQADTTTSELERILGQGLVAKKSIPDIDFGIYQLNNYEWSGDKTAPVLGSHGCVRQCSFCDVMKHSPVYSFVEADQLSQQIVDVYQQTGINKFIFMDSLVNGSLKNFENLLRNLAQSRRQGWLPENFSWSGTYICRPRSTQLDRIHKLLPESGVDSVVIGVETGSDGIRWNMDKKFTNQDLLYELLAFRSNGVKTQLLFFPSWPTETLDDFQDTLKLFLQLAEFAQQYTVDGVSLGTSGFSLIDGTPIDSNKDSIGLESGPAPFLWKCHSNPELNFWESIRRRILMTSVCEHYGIKLVEENVFRRYLSLNLNRHRDIIFDYSGSCDHNIINHDEILKCLPNKHKIKLRIVNSGSHNVIAKTQNYQHVCSPGVSQWEFDLTKPFDKSLLFEINFEFESDYQAQLSRYDSGDYYSKNGIYLDFVQVDYRDITLWGFNQITQQKIDSNTKLPEDFYQHQNQRCVVANTALYWSIPERTGLQAWLLKNLHSAEYQERVYVDSRLAKELSWYNQQT
jgi:hypothetical protein